MSNIWLGNYKLMINVARFVKEDEKGDDIKNKSGKNNGDIFKDQKDNVHNINIKKKEQVYGNSFINTGRSFADTVAGKDYGSTKMKEVVVSGYVNAYRDLHGKAIIGKAKDLWTIRKLDILLKEANYGKVMIKYLGGLNVLLVFQSSIETDRFRTGSPGFGWFASMEIWRGQSVAFERLAWLNIYRVPLHLAEIETFDSVGRRFGKVIHASQRQPEDNVLTSECVCVMTDSVKRIEEEVVIIENGKRFRIWVEEERGDWIPDSVERQESPADEEEEWELLSKGSGSIKMKGQFNYDIPVRQTEFGDWGHSVDKGDADNEEVLPTADKGIHGKDKKFETSNSSSDDEFADGRS
ncbi:hypothetical protein HanOQP8_Chr08g0296181 [Helianthus annuus]|nr:hypothetical protein HanIR_Chr08g0378881 [Helianthus annuus]KAJ0720053.1 hypothetical protein HanLR1_Chr08g0288711 [Helianthus annuus]KAJ0723277.1 hypothetical protein HanOQP8_Chr08g0296181 [Helianthus annuus]